MPRVDGGSSQWRVDGQEFPALETQKTASKSQTQRQYTDIDLHRSPATTGVGGTESSWSNIEATMVLAKPIEIVQPVAMADVAEPGGPARTGAGGPVVTEISRTTAPDGTGASGSRSNGTDAPVTPEFCFESENNRITVSGPAGTGTGGPVGDERVRSLTDGIAEVGVRTGTRTGGPVVAGVRFTTVAEVYAPITGTKISQRNDVSESDQIEQVNVEMANSDQLECLSVTKDSVLSGDRTRDSGDDRVGHVMDPDVIRRMSDTEQILIPSGCSLDNNMETDQLECLSIKKDSVLCGDMTKNSGDNRVGDVMDPDVIRRMSDTEQILIPSGCSTDDNMGPDPKEGDAIMVGVVGSAAPWYLTGWTNEVEVEFMIDTGCQVTILATSVFHKMCDIHPEVKLGLIPCTQRLVSADNSPLTVIGRIKLNVVFPGLQCEMWCVVAGIGTDGLLGTEALQSCLPHQLDLRTGQLWADGRSTLQLYERQFGFRAKRSTIQAIIELNTDIIESFEDKDITMATFLDLSKAFDTIDHTILLEKLRRYGIRGIALNWFKSYLTNRSHFVKYKNYSSAPSDMICGVPQGSVLGPLLFIIYTNDLPNCLKTCKCILFADDTTIYKKSSNLSELYSTLNTELNALADWFRANKLSLNVGKTVYMIFSNNHKMPLNTSLVLRLGTQSIKQVKHTQFLGLHIDDKLKWSEHLKHVKSKLSSSLFAIRTAKNILSIDQLKTLYNSMFYPYLDYGIILWGVAAQNLIKPIEILQKKAIRLLGNSTYNATTAPIFKSLNLLNVKDINKLQMYKLLYKLHDNTLPKTLKDMFTPNYEIHQHHTRNRNNPHILHRRTAISEHSIVFSGPTLWQQLPHSHKQIKTIHSFTREIKKRMIQNY